MGGGGGIISKAKEKVEETTKSAKKAVQLAASPVSFGIEAAADIAGAKGDVKKFTDRASFLADPTGRPGQIIGGGVGSKLVDQPKEAAELSKRIAAQTAAAQRKQLKDIETQKKQSAAEKEASEELRKRRAAQTRRSRKTGRRSTILTDKLGESGGESGAGRKSLLGY